MAVEFVWGRLGYRTDLRCGEKDTTLMHCMLELIAVQETVPSPVLHAKDLAKKQQFSQASDRQRTRRQLTPQNPSMMATRSDLLTPL